MLRKRLATKYKLTKIQQNMDLYRHSVSFINQAFLCGARAHSRWHPDLFEMHLYIPCKK